MGHTFLFLCVFCDFVIVVVGNWIFKSKNMISGNQILDFLWFAICLVLIAVGCLCAEDQPEV